MPTGFINVWYRIDNVLYWYSVDRTNTRTNSQTIFFYKWAYETRYLKLYVEIWLLISLSCTREHFIRNKSNQFQLFQYNEINKKFNRWNSISLFCFIWFDFISRYASAGKMCKIIKWLIHWATCLFFCFVAIDKSRI